MMGCSINIFFSCSGQDVVEEKLDQELTKHLHVCFL